ncbi:MAG TPA: two-component regulator propeller domain-containing protein, partial [Gammaproteobacteria bacterium]
MGRETLRAGTFLRGAIFGALALLVLVTPSTALAVDPEKSFYDYVKDTWSIEEGLPQITAVAIEQDGEGFLWIGTQAGVARFDGIRFTAFTPDNTPALPGLFVQDLFVDSHSRLWVATYKGIAVYENHTFRRVPFLQLGDQEESIDARMIAETRGGDIVIAAVEGLFRVTGDRLVPFAPRDGISAYSLAAQDDALLVGGVGTVLRIGTDGSVIDMPLPRDEDNALVTQFAFAQGRLWAGTSHGLFWRDGNQWQRFNSEDVLAAQPIDALFEDSDRNLWVGTHKGLGRIRDHKLVEFVLDTDPLAHRNIRAIFEDHEGNLWLGSQWQGIARLWDGWTRRFAGAYGLNDPVAWSLTRGHDGQLWVGTNRGLSVFDGERYREVIPEEELPHPNAYTLLDDGERLWIGTRTGLVWYDYRTGRHWMPEIFAPLATTQVSGIVKDSRGIVWLAANNGLYRYHPDSGELFHYGEQQGLTESRTRLVYESPSGRLYLGTREGLFEVQGSRVRKIGADAGLRDNIDVTSITELDDGSLVIGTLSEELFLNADGAWYEFTVRSGLPVNSPFFLAEDERGYLWAAGIRGLFRVPITDLHQYRKGEIPSVHAEMLLSERGDERGSQKAYCCNGAGNAKGFIEDEILWLPTRGGVIAVDTRRIQKNTVAPNVVIERLRFDEQWHPWIAGIPFELPPSARDIAVEFTTLSFQQPNSVQMRYRLRGYDDAWHDLEDANHRSVAYTNLPPGDYVFEARGTNNAGVWAPEAASMPFTLLPHFYETTWFRLLVAATLLLAIFAGHRYQLRHLRAQRAELERVVRQRTEELRIANKNLQ